MARSIAQLFHQYVGKRCAVDIGDGVEVLAICTEARVAYGNEHLLVQPVGGVGSKWVGTANVRVAPDDWPTNEFRHAGTAKQVAAHYVSLKRANVSVPLPKILEDALELLASMYNFNAPPQAVKSVLKEHEEDAATPPHPLAASGSGPSDFTRQI